VVTAIDDDDTPPTISDANQSFPSSLQTKYASFTDIAVPTTETIYPNSNTAFYNGGVAPDSSSGTFADLDTPGSSGMKLQDNNNRATDYYGIDIKWTVPNQATTTQVDIYLEVECAGRNHYAANGSDMPLIEIYDFDAPGWVIADEAGIVGVGRLSSVYDAWGMSHTSAFAVPIQITSNITRFFDGSNEGYVRITMGNSNAEDIIRCYFAPADGVRVNDTFKVGDLLHNVVAAIWTAAAIVWADYSFDTSTLIDATDYRGTYVGTVLKRYAKQQNWEVWDAIGWTIKCDAPATSTALSLTQTNFTKFTFGAHGSSVTRSVIVGCQNTFAASRPDWKGYRQYRDDLDVDDFFPTATAAASAGPNYITRDENIAHPFVGTIDMDDGTNYAAIELGKLITITLYTNKHVYTEGIITSVSYTQESGGHLYCQIKVKV
jgi:hypothetical protein